LPTQGFFNALIYFRNTTKQARRTVEQESRSSSDFTPPCRYWGSFRRVFTSRRSSASADPIAPSVAGAIQEQALQDSKKEDPGVEQSDRNEATEGSRILSDPVGMELSITSETDLEHDRIENELVSTEFG
jgi:hypothetical protein